MSNLRENIKKHMLARNWSAYDLQNASGVAQPTIHRFLKGEHREIREKTVKKIAQAFNQTEAQLRGFEQTALIVGDSTLAEQTEPGVSLIEPGQKKAPVQPSGNQTAQQISELIRVIGDGNLSAEEIQLLVVIAQKFRQ